MEIEAKFAIPNLQILDLLQTAQHLAGFELLPGEVRQIRDMYLDTNDRQILAAGYACRRRQHDERVLITLKGLGAAKDAVHRREEWEVTVSADQEPSDWPAGAVREQVLTWTKGTPLVPLFELSQTRVVRPVRRGEVLVAEMSLDQVQVAADERQQNYLELEIELKAEGTEQDLAALVASLRDEWGLQPEPHSKFERALSFVQGQPLRTKLVTAHERAVLQQIVLRGDHFARRAVTLLALDEGLTQRESSERADLSERRVRYWLGRFRRERLRVFPARVLARAVPAASSSPAETEATARPAEPTPVAGITVRHKPEQPLAEPVEPPGKPGLQADDSMAEAGRKTLYFHLQHMLSHEPGTRQGEDIEELHDMRVATRRMRAAMRVFGDYLDAKQMAPFVKGLRRTGRTLGTVRDLDVFHEKVQAYLDTLPAERRDDLSPLLTVWKAQRESARREMLAYLDSERYLRFKTEFGQFLRQPGAAALPALTTQGEPAPNRLRHVVPAILYRGLAAVQAYEEWVSRPNVPLEQFHQLRIASKGLRYALEFFREVLGRESKDLIETVKGLQDHLGNLQDAVVACNLLRDFLTWGNWGHPTDRKTTWPTTPIVAPGVATYMAFRQAEIQQLVSTFPLVWDKVRSHGFNQGIQAALVALW